MDERQPTAAICCFGYTEIMSKPICPLPVLVLYQTKLEDSRTWQSLIAPWEGLEEVLVIDNGPQAVSFPSILDGKRIRFHHFQHNPGLAYAYNFAAAEARKLGYTHVLLLDQDSGFPIDAGKHYVEKLQSMPSVDAVSLYVLGGYAFFSPCLFQEGKSTRHYPDITLQPECYPLNEVSVINSGLMVSLNAFERSGGYTERIALDWSDISFCHKLGKLGLQVHILPLVMRQGWSVLEKKSRKSSLSRYRYLCRGGRYLAVEANSFLPLAWSVMMQGAKLSIRYGNPVFLWYFLRHYLFLKV